MELVAGPPGERRAHGAARAARGRAGRDERHGRPRVSGTAQGYDATVAVTPETKLDAHRLRADFAVFDELVNGRSVAFLDSAASTQKPRQVLDAMRDFYEHSYANVHRGVYRLAERATTGYEAARGKVAGFVNAPSEREVIFTRSATEALNLVAYAWGLDNLGPGDVVVVTDLEHHSSFVPWQYVAGRTGAAFRAIPIDEAGELQLDALDDFERDGNGQGRRVEPRLEHARHRQPGRATSPPGRTSAARSWSWTQRRPHRIGRSTCRRSTASSSRSRRTRCAVRAGSARSGDARELLESMAPFNLGGEMIRSVSMERTTWNELPYKFEAGTPAIAEAVGFGAAIDYVLDVGLDAIEQHEHDLVEYALGRLGELPWITTYGPPPERRAGIVSLNVDGVHPHDVAQVLDWEGVAVRAGHHCTQPLMAKLGVAATMRASFYLYSIPEEIDRLVDGLHKAKSSLG